MKIFDNYNECWRLRLYPFLNYNTRPLASEILLKKGKAKIIEKKKISEIINGDIF